jgi:hypothetical protein
MNVTGRYDECIGLAAPIATIQPLDSGPQAGSKPRLRTFRSRVFADVAAPIAFGRSTSLSRIPLAWAERPKSPPSRRNTGVRDIGAFASRDTMKIGRWMPIGSELSRGMGFAAQGGGALSQPE